MRTARTSQDPRRLIGPRLGLVVILAAVLPARGVNADEPGKIDVVTGVGVGRFKPEEIPAVTAYQFGVMLDSGRRALGWAGKFDWDFIMAEEEMGFRFDLAPLATYRQALNEKLSLLIAAGPVATYVNDGGSFGFGGLADISIGIPMLQGYLSVAATRDDGMQLLAVGGVRLSYGAMAQMRSSSPSSGGAEEEPAGDESAGDESPAEESAGEEASDEAPSEAPAEAACLANGTVLGDDKTSGDCCSKKSTPHGGSAAPSRCCDPSTTSGACSM